MFKIIVKMTHMELLSGVMLQTWHRHVFADSQRQKEKKLEFE